MRQVFSAMMTRRMFKTIFQRAWFLLFMVPWKAKAQLCCFSVWVNCQNPGGGCLGCGQTCSNTDGLFAYDDDYNPSIYYGILGISCIFCQDGCSCCDAVKVTAYGVCCGTLSAYNGTMCCTDCRCCSGCGTCL